MINFIIRSPYFWLTNFIRDEFLDIWPTYSPMVYQYINLINICLTPFHNCNDSILQNPYKDFKIWHTNCSLFACLYFSFSANIGLFWHQRGSGLGNEVSIGETTLYHLPMSPRYTKGRVWLKNWDEWTFWCRDPRVGMLCFTWSMPVNLSLPFFPPKMAVLTTSKHRKAHLSGQRRK